MRRCIYFNKVVWLDEDGSVITGIGCYRHQYVYCYNPETNDCSSICSSYQPVELDPYWKDIVEQTNRRLNNGR